MGRLRGRRRAGCRTGEMHRDLRSVIYSAVGRGPELFAAHRFELQHGRETIRYFAHARTALKHGLQSLRLEPGDAILVPDYVCDVILHPLGELGLEHRDYPLTDELAPDWNELERRVTPATRAVLMVHYFGQPHDLARFRDFCEEHDLRLVEDNAHGHAGEIDGRPLGSFGDVGISSPRKFLNTPYGGALWLDGQEVYPDDDVRLYSVSPVRQLQRRISRRFPGLNQRLKTWVRGRPPYEDPRAYREGPVEDRCADSNSAKIFEETDWSAVRARRQQAYEAWRGFAESHGLAPVYHALHPGANPWCFPAYAADSAEAEKWCAWSSRNGATVFRWPALPEERIVENGACMERWRRLLCFSTETEPPRESSI